MKGNGQSQMQKTGGIVAIIPRGEVLRNFGFTGAFDAIAERTPLSLISVKAPSSCQGYFDRLGAEVYPLTELPEPWLVRIQREVLDLAHGRWIWSRAAQARWQTRDMEAVTVADKAKRLGKKAVGIAMANKPGLNVLNIAERSTSRMLSSREGYASLYRSLRPGLVFNGSHIHSRNAIQAVQSAQWLGIPTATFVFSWDNLTSQGRVILPYDYFLVWNEALKTQLLEMYQWIRPENVFVTGTPQFDFHFRPEFYMGREEFCNSIGADPDRPIVFYSTGMANHMPGEPEIVEQIADMVGGIDKPVRPQLLVRVYPKDQTGRFDDLKKRRKDILFPSVAWEPEWLTPRYEDSFALVNTLRHCAVGINVASTISLELCMFDKPVINVGYNPASVPETEVSYARYYEFDHYKPVVDSGAIRVAASAREMRAMILEGLEHPERDRAERAKLVSSMFGDMLDGNSSTRVADTLLKLASAKSYV